MNGPTMSPSVRMADLRRIVAWLDRSRIAQIEIESPGVRVRMVMQAPSEPTTAPTMDHAHHRPLAAHPCANAETPASVVVAARSPGHFLAAHPSQGRALCALGTQVRQGDYLGLLRSGLVYQPVVAPIDGELVGMTCEPGAQVGFATPLFHIAPLLNPVSPKENRP